MPDQPVPMTAERLGQATRDLNLCDNVELLRWWSVKLLAEVERQAGEIARQSSVLFHIHEAIGEDPGSDDESLPDVVRQIVTEQQERIAEQDAETEKLKKRSEGHDKPCFDCGQRTNDLSGDPGRWGIPLCHSEHPGVVQWHHAGCVSNRLAERDALKARLDALPGKIDKVLDRWLGQTRPKEISSSIRSLVADAEGKL